MRMQPINRGRAESMVIAVWLAVSCHAGVSAAEPIKPDTTVVAANAPIAPTMSAVALVATTPSAGPVFESPPGYLDNYFAALGNRRVVVTFFGDSHTAGDAMTSWLRDQLTARHGDAGRGFVAMGKPPMKHYYQRDVHYGREGKWESFVGGHKGDSEPFGQSGIRVEARKGNAQMWVETCSDCKSGNMVGRFVLHLWRHHGGAKFRYRIDDGRWREADSDTRKGESDHVDLLSIATPNDGAHRFTVERIAKGQGGLVLLGVTFERNVSQGVSVDSIGLVGRRMSELNARDWSVLSAQLAQRIPNVIVLQYGTNEADDPDTDLVALSRHYDELITKLKSAAPRTAIIVLGPPDMAKRDAGKACDDAKKFPIDATTGIPPVECQWLTPPLLAPIVDVQRQAAARNHVAFFDSLQALGGAGIMPGFVVADPKLAFSDHVHFTSLGYQRWGQALLDSLDHQSQLAHRTAP
jgi:lysophospholipase L1-like esterase